MSPSLPRIALVTAASRDEVSGNATTIERFDRLLRARGVEVGLFRLPEVGGEAGLLEAVRAYGPRVVHALHARHAGPAALAAANALGVPLVVSAGGTDIDQDLFEPARAAIVRVVLAGARVLLVTHPDARQRAVDLGLPVRVLLVPEAADPAPPRPPPDPGHFGVGDDEPLFVLPAGVRPVKNNRFPIEPLARLRAEGVPVRLLLAGPSWDDAYAAALRADLGRHPFASWPGTFVGPERELLYATATVVLNVSHSEGGANAVLEAMARSACVLASPIPANVLFLSPGEDRPEAGRLYRATATDDPRVLRHDPDDFLRHARELATSPVLRARLAGAARDRARTEHDPDAEVDGLLAGYRVALARPVIS